MGAPQKKKKKSASKFGACEIFRQILMLKTLGFHLISRKDIHVKGEKRFGSFKAFSVSALTFADGTRCSDVRCRVSAAWKVLTKR